MRKLMKKIDNKLFAARNAMKAFMNSDRGDTNFVSIAIILVVIIVIAILFITLGQNMASKLGEKIRELMDALG